MKVDLHGTRGEFPQAVEAALSCARRFGLELPLRPNPEELRATVQALWEELEQRKLESLRICRRCTAPGSEGAPGALRGRLATCVLHQPGSARSARLPDGECQPPSRKRGRLRHGLRRLRAGHGPRPQEVARGVPPRRARGRPDGQAGHRRKQGEGVPRSSEASSTTGSITSGKCFRCSGRARPPHARPESSPSPAMPSTNLGVFRFMMGDALEDVSPRPRPPWTSPPHQEDAAWLAMADLREVVECLRQRTEAPPVAPDA